MLTNILGVLASFAVSGAVCGAQAQLQASSAATVTEVRRAEAPPLQQRAAEAGATRTSTTGERSQVPTATEKSAQTPTIGEKAAGMQKLPGYFNLYWDAKQGKLWLEIDKWGTEFLYQTGLPAGIGSNDIGLDRGQLGPNADAARVHAGGAKDWRSRADRSRLSQPSFHRRGTGRA